MEERDLIALAWSCGIVNDEIRPGNWLATSTSIKRFANSIIEMCARETDARASDVVGKALRRMKVPHASDKPIKEGSRRTKWIC